jgi:hypothetical protein
VTDVVTVPRFPIDATAVLAFARAVGDNDPAYESAVDGTGRKDPVVPLTFVQASAHVDPAFALRPGPDGAWFGSGRNPGTVEQASANRLHAEQHFEYHRPLRIGDVLSATTRDGGSWSKQGRRGGTLHFFETIVDYRDEAGELVVTVRSVGVQTELVPQAAG